MDADGRGWPDAFYPCLSACIRGSIPSVAAGRAALQSVRIAQFREDFTTDYTDYTDGKEKRKCGKEDLLIRVIRVICGKFLWLRLCRAALFVLLGG
jgi:hypothetical protein